MIVKSAKNEIKSKAGKKWYCAFVQRHPELSLREPENTSLVRAQGINRPRIEAFSIHVRYVVYAVTLSLTTKRTLTLNQLSAVMGNS